MGWAQGAYPARSVLRFGLRVAIPGREPYEVIVRQNFVPWEIPAVGQFVAVQVDSTNPQKVRIGPGRPVAPSGAGSFDEAVSDQMQRMNRIQQMMERTSAGPVLSAADLLATGQRVSGALKSFAPTGTTPRSLGRTPSRPEFADAPHYDLVIELLFPNLAPMEARTRQTVPPAQVPNLAIGLQLPCAVDPANPQLCVVDWDAIAH